ncbi:rab3 GTPase-activating protein non-catalytic subunit-like [Stegodyphus dumicola]|uniref:rab3 GTPase-activating protein non-catalytic subunit-like n=1 Tax=Stegodyphus dumicola TaxID=202533 RepID=UPI0015AC886F|nr:rab3 GTPase-activating protein non-catalytic subunit-like [Stegodyphus dumicola]
MFHVFLINKKQIFQMYSGSLCISEAEVGRILSLVMLHQTVVPVLKRQVRFTDDNATEMSFSDFMSCFVVHDSHLIKSGEEIMLQNLPVDLSNGISGKQIEELGGFLFHSSIHVGECFSTLQVALKESGILPEKLLFLLLKHWVSDAGFCPNADKWINLQQVMKHISSLSGKSQIVKLRIQNMFPGGVSVVQPSEATGNVAAYIGAVVARSVSVIMAASFSVEHRKANGDKKSCNDKDNEESGESDWESVSLDLEHWNLRVKQLEDILMLNILLKSQPYGKAVVKDVNISIETLLNSGQGYHGGYSIWHQLYHYWRVYHLLRQNRKVPGSVTDLVAVWAVSVGLEPEVLSSFLSAEDTDDVSVPQKFLDDKSDSRSLNIVKGLLNDVRKKFPHSLNHDALLANCCWEHLMQWSKNKDAVNHLDKSLSCLNFVGSPLIKNDSMHIEKTVVDCQSGFRKFYHRANIQHLTDYRKEFGINTLHIFIDFKTACDSINREAIIAALREFKIPENY